MNLPNGSAIIQGLAERITRTMEERDYLPLKRDDLHLFKFLASKNISGNTWIVNLMQQKISTCR